MSDAIDPNVLLAYVEGELSADQAAEVERELANDPQLASVVSGLKADRDALRAMPRLTPSPLSLEPAQGALERNVLLGDPEPMYASSDSTPKPATPDPRRHVIYRIGALTGVAAGLVLASVLGLVWLSETPLGNMASHQGPDTPPPAPRTFTDEREGNDGESLADGTISKPADQPMEGIETDPPAPASPPGRSGSSSADPLASAGTGESAELRDVEDAVSERDDFAALGIDIAGGGNSTAAEEAAWWKERRWRDDNRIAIAHTDDQFAEQAQAPQVINVQVPEPERAREQVLAWVRSNKIPVLDDTAISLEKAQRSLSRNSANLEAEQSDAVDMNDNGRQSAQEAELYQQGGQRQQRLVLVMDRSKTDDLLRQIEPRQSDRASGYRLNYDSPLDGRPEPSDYEDVKAAKDQSVGLDDLDPEAKGEKLKLSTPRMGKASDPDDREAPKAEGNGGGGISPAAPDADATRSKGDLYPANTPSPVPTPDPEPVPPGVVRGGFEDDGASRTLVAGEAMAREERTNTVSDRREFDTKLSESAADESYDFSRRSNNRYAEYFRQTPTLVTAPPPPLLARAELSGEVIVLNIDPLYDETELDAVDSAATRRSVDSDEVLESEAEPAEPSR